MIQKQLIDSTGSTQLYSVFDLTSRKNAREALITIEVEVSGEKLKMEVDTGANFSVISGVAFKRLCEKGTRLLKPSKLQLRTPLKTRGEAMAVVRHYGQEKKLPLLVVPGDGASLLGRYWMRKH